jgi:glutamine amidotransferase
LVIPGVGSFDAGMRRLENSGWIGVLNQAAFERRMPILGICLGMQLLCRKSGEGVLPGLGWVDADVVAFDRSVLGGLKIPHMGWSVVTPHCDNPLLPLSLSDQRFYHVHKFHAVCDRPESVLATCDYGITFTTAIRRDNIFGVQFHPEKSHRFGMALLRRFIEIPC